MVSASTSLNPPLLEIRVSHGNAAVAADTAQIVAEEFIDYTINQRLAEIARVQSVAAIQGVTDLQGLVGSQFSAIDSLSLLEPVSTPGSPILPRNRRDTTIGALLGFLVAVAGILILESMGDSVRTVEQLSSRFGVSGLGGIFRWSSREAGEREIIISKAPASSYAEAFRQIRVNLEFAVAGLRGNVLLVSSPQPGEGKSTILANLAVAMAQSGKRIAVVDADLRRPSLHRLFSTVHRQPGLSNVLASQDTTLQDAMSPSHVEGLDCWQSAQVGQIRTREDYYYEELRVSSLRVLL